MTIVRVAAALAALVTAFLLQATIVGPLAAPLPVSLPAVLVVAVAIYAGPATGLVLGFAGGLLADLSADHPLGVLALTWLGAGVLAGCLGAIVLTPAPIRRGPVRVAASRRAAPRNRERTAGLARVAATTGVLAAAAGLVAAVLLALLDAAPGPLPAEAVRTVPTALLDAVLALAVLPAARAVLRSAALRPAPSVREPDRRPDPVGAP